MTVDRRNTETDDGSQSASNQGRRGFTKLGLAAPVLFSLGSRPVLAGACLSNILSGNLSDPGRGDCQLGWSPGGWKNPGGQIAGMPTLTAWDIATGMTDGYGTYDPECGNANQRRCYDGGATPADVGLSLTGIDLDTPLREIVDTQGGYDNQVRRACVTAFLNAALSENSGAFQYVLSVQDVKDLCSGAMDPPGLMDVKGFLEWTWEAGPEGSSDYVFDNN